MKSMGNFKLKISDLILCVLYLVILIIFFLFKGNTKMTFSDVDNEITNFKTVKFGRLILTEDQDSDVNDMEWIVLDEKDDKYLLLSKYCILSFIFHNDYGKLNWNNSLLRYYLNNQFYELSFYESERAEIYRNDVENINPNIFGKDFGVNTYDDIFMLSVEECEKYFSDDDSRIAKYKKIDDNGEIEYINVYYWTRTKGFNEYDIATINSDGSINYYGYDIMTSEIYIRPAMWVNKDYFEKKG